MIDFLEKEERFTHLCMHTCGRERGVAILCLPTCGHERGVAILCLPTCGREMGWRFYVCLHVGVRWGRDFIPANM